MRGREGPTGVLNGDDGFLGVVHNSAALLPEKGDRDLHIPGQFARTISWKE